MFVCRSIQIVLKTIMFVCRSIQYVCRSIQFVLKTIMYVCRSIQFIRKTMYMHVDLVGLCVEGCEYAIPNAHVNDLI